MSSAKPSSGKLFYTWTLELSYPLVHIISTHPLPFNTDLSVSLLPLPLSLRLPWVLSSSAFSTSSLQILVRFPESPSGLPKLTNHTHKNYAHSSNTSSLTKLV